MRSSGCPNECRYGRGRTKNSRRISNRAQRRTFRRTVHRGQCRTGRRTFHQGERQRTRVEPECRRAVRRRFIISRLYSVGFLLILQLFLYSALLPAEPVASLTPESFQFTTVAQGRIVEGSFILENDGDETLEYRLRTSCNCLTVPAAGGRLEAGGRTIVAFTFDTGPYEGYTAHQIIISTNDQETPVRYFVVEGIIKPDGQVAKKVGDPPDEGGYSTPQEGAGSGPLRYDTGFSLKRVRDEQGAAYFSYKNCVECRDLYVDLSSWAERNGYTPLFYALEEGENKQALYTLVKNLGEFPKLPILLVGETMYAGKTEIEAKLGGGPVSGTNIEGGSGQSQDGSAPTRGRLETNIASIFLVGLLDGVNPCAFTVIILLLSYLSLQLKNAAKVMTAGIFYIIAVFVTYYLVGLGLFEAFRTLQGFREVARVFKYVLSGVLFFLAAVSIYDFFKSRRQELDDMVLKLPRFFQDRIRGNIRAQMKNYKIVTGSLALGFLISLFELVCTGQVYIPIIGFMVRSQQERFFGLLLLFIYNIGFIAPLAAIFILVYRGISSATIGTFLREKVSWIKAGFVVLFLLFGVLNLVV